MLKPVEVKALPSYRLWVRYEDGVEGAGKSEASR